MVQCALILIGGMIFTSCDKAHSGDDVAMAGVDLSASACANCYIVSMSGQYMFKAVKGNSDASVGSAASAVILWETFGTNTAPVPGDLIKNVSYKDGYVFFQTADVFKEGNAVIAVKDADDVILWSWHIWMTDQPEEHVYYNDAGTMMDRNLGAISTTPGDPGALGLSYQWGRKDPFLGPAYATANIAAQSTIGKLVKESSEDEAKGTIEYAIANPATFITYNSSNYDWYYSWRDKMENTRWTESCYPKSIYDPCPAGWRVPDGGPEGVWAKASALANLFKVTSDEEKHGIDFSGVLGDSPSIWYPASGYRDTKGGLTKIGLLGFYWSASTMDYSAYMLRIGYEGTVVSASYNSRANACCVRCAKE